MLVSPILPNRTYSQFSGISNGTSSAIHTGSFLPTFSYGKLSVAKICNILRRWRQKATALFKNAVKTCRQIQKSDGGKCRHLQNIGNHDGKKCRHILKVTAKSAVISHYQGFQGLFPWPEAFWRWRHKCVSGKRLRIYEEKSQRIRHAILRASRYKEISHSILQSFHPTNKNKQADRQVHPTAFIQIKQAHPRHRM